MLPKYRALLQRGLSILVFSGDVDAIVPVRRSLPTLCMQRCFQSCFASNTGLCLGPCMDAPFQQAAQKPHLNYRILEIEACDGMSDQAGGGFDCGR